MNGANRTALKDHFLKRLKYDPAKGRQEYFDPSTYGYGTFGVRVNKTSISYILLYNFHGKPRRLTIGNYPQMALAEARTKAQQAAQLASEGIDPGQKQTLELFEYRNSPSVAEAVDIYLDWARVNKKSWEEDQRQLERDFVAPLRYMKIKDVKRKQVMALLDAKAKTAPVAANRLQSVVRKLFNFCVEREILDATPLVQMKRIAKESPRERALNQKEVIWLLQQLTSPSITVPTRFAAILSLMLAQRTGTIVSMRWVDINLGEGMWDRSGRLEKNDNPIAIPLSGQASIILDYLLDLQHARVKEGIQDRVSEWVFPGRGTDSHQTQPSLNRAMRRLYDDYVKDKELVQKEGLLRIAEGYPRPTAHDLRRTATTHMSKRGLGKDIRGRILNHKNLTVDAIYDRYSYFDEKDVALVDWHNHLTGLLKGLFLDQGWIDVYGHGAQQKAPRERLLAS